MRLVVVSVVGLGICGLQVRGEGQRRRLGKKKHGGHGGHGGGEEYIPIRTSSSMLTDPNTYGYGLPPMAPFPEEAMMLSSQETVLPGYEQYDQPGFMLGGLNDYGHHHKNKHQQEWEPMQAILPEVIHPEPMPFKGKSAPPVKGATLPPILPPPPPPPPIIQPTVVHKYAEPPPVEGKKSKHGEGHGEKHGGGHGGKHGEGGHGGKKKGKKHHEVAAPQPIVVVIPQKHIMPDIPPPPQKHVPAKHGHTGFGHMDSDYMGPGHMGHGHRGHGHMGHGDMGYEEGGYVEPSYGDSPHFEHGLGHENEYVVAPYAPTDYHEHMDMEMGHHDWVPVSMAPPHPTSSYGDIGHPPFHDSGYRVVSKANDPWV